MHTISVRAVPTDLLIIGAELVTGKSIPVIVAITRLPMDQVLAWLMLCMGAVAGSLFSVYTARAVAGMTVLGFVNRLAQLCLSVALSLSLLLALARGLHAERGVALSVIPAFCVLVQTLPQRESTALLAFILNFGAFYVCMVTPAWARPEEEAMLPAHAASLAEEAASVGQTVGRALQLFVLAFYACIQHAPTTVYFGTDPSGATRPSVYASHHLDRHAHYSLFIALTAAWLRLCVWSSVCFFQNNFMHVVLESRHGGGWDWFGCFVYMTALLYSACWTATQLREQVLPRFQYAITETDRLKLATFILAVAALLWRGGDQTVYTLTTIGAASCVATTVFTLKLLQLVA